ncbi:hypothetical protein Y032_0167g121 [Ancylostoma ceylanicum]|uniref:Uncharacterized protein n=2 Tax=Ancylostoma ceylanicum TaxID=53326 RepID=A0A016SWH6_9BILA|nr:hypothetical protein Y032_0167g121 [Ancylostoma ceylanicum]
MECTTPLTCNEAEAEGEEDLVDLCRRLDTQLEEKAKMHNLNALNVKSILHRLIRDPHVLSTLMGIKGESDDIPTLKVTRSKVKHSSSELAKVELKPVQPPRTFLDVQFENEDEDEDYRPEEVQISDGVNDDAEVSPYQLRSRVPHIDQSSAYDSLDSGFLHDSFDTFTDYHGQEMLTFVENPDYLSFLQGIQASTPAHENENVTADDDDPDDEEYNVLTELDKLKEYEKDKDELRMDRFTEIPMREVEGLFLDLIGDDVETIRPELIPLKTQTPKKKRTKKRRSAEMSDSKKSSDNQKNALDTCFYEGIGESSLFNIYNLSAAIESCHDIMGITPVEEEQVKWDPNPFGWSPRPEAALVLGRSRAIIYPDLLPGVQPDLFEFPHQFFTPGEDLLLAHALIQFRHIPSTPKDPFGRLYWVQKMLLPCKTISQIRAHIRLARNHVEGQVNNRNPIYQIIMQALRGVCHLRFPFERPLVRYETLQMWPEEERPIWFNKFLKHFMTVGPTMVIPYGIANRQSTPPAPVYEGVAVPVVPVVPAVVFTTEKKPTVAVCSCSIFYEESASGRFCATDSFAMLDTLQIADSLDLVKPTSIVTSTDISSVIVKDEPEANTRMQISDLELLPNQSNLGIPAQDLLCDLSLYNPVLGPSESNEIIDQTCDEVIEEAPMLPDICEAQEEEFSVYEPERDITTVKRTNGGLQASSASQHLESLQIPKSEFSFDAELEEGEIVSTENSREAPIAADKPTARKETSPYDFRSRPKLRSKSKSPLHKNETRERSSRSYNRAGSSGRQDISKQQPSRYRERTGENQKRAGNGRCRIRRRSSDSDWQPEHSPDRKRKKKGGQQQPELVRRSSRRVQERVRGSSPSSKSAKRDEEKSGSHQRTSRRADNNGGQLHSGFASCSVTQELKVNKRTAEVLKLMKTKVKQLIRVKKDLSASSAAVIDQTANNPGTSAVLSIDVPCSGSSMGAAENSFESPLKTWRDSDCALEDFGLHSLMGESNAMGETALPDYDVTCAIPRTPTFSTPSNYSPLGTFYQLSGSRSRSPFSDTGVPVTPRDDALTRSPTLLRAPSAASRALFAKIEVKRVPNVPVTSADLTGVEQSTSYWRSTWDCENSDPVPYHDGSDARPSSAFDGGGHDDSEDVPSKSLDDLDAGGKTRMKRRTRTEKERMGLEMMQNQPHRSRQMQSLARKIADDIRQRTFMHEDVWRTVEKIVLGDDNLEAQFDRLKAALLPKHADVLALLSLLTDDAILPPELLTSPLRRAYHGAVQMLLAIEAYCHGTRSRSSNTRSLLRTIGSMGQTLSESEFCDRLSDLLSNERPLWNYIRQWLPLPYDENVTPADFEFIDLRRLEDKDLKDDDGSERIDDLNAVLGAFTPKKGGSLQVAGGQLNSLQNGSYLPVLVTKEREHSEENKVPQEPIWTKDVDILILQTYNNVDGNCEDVVKVLTEKIPYSFKHIEKRLNFLLSLF